MEAVDHLYDCTKRLYLHLKRGLPPEDRESYIADIHQLLEDRQQWIERLPSGYNGGQVKFRDEILACDRAIQGLLGAMFDEIREEMHRIQKQKTTNERYASPYRNGSVDGVFLDKRK